uniref:Uncharacterized protein n=1 Tax=viral metagenome TaxID=1070528 RepID=A0A6M3LEB9_9ZZZZ
MTSPRLNDLQLNKRFGKRGEGQPFDYPQELGYCCPKGHTGDYLTWSEFKEHIWCFKCKKDYHYAEDCLLKRMCWMGKSQWDSFLKSLPIKPKIIRGTQHFPDCEIPHRKSG